MEGSSRDKMLVIVITSGLHTIEELTISTILSYKSNETRVTFHEPNNSSFKLLLYILSLTVGGITDT